MIGSTFLPEISNLRLSARGRPTDYCGRLCQMRSARRVLRGLSGNVHVFTGIG
ncbi:hypothetical protein BGY98DRAFT_1039965 [Russula aff. rugulosa BPL654]|nr:hypothetical protein BGY98DRAFT_1039965 [Russula aff. rugulosa BPL654]